MDTADVDRDGYGNRGVAGDAIFCDRCGGRLSSNRGNWTCGNQMCRTDLDPPANEVASGRRSGTVTIIQEDSEVMDLSDEH